MTHPVGMGFRKPALYGGGEDGVMLVKAGGSSDVTRHRHKTTVHAAYVGNDPVLTELPLENELVG